MARKSSSPKAKTSAQPPSDAIIVPEPETASSLTEPIPADPQTETMEVHHHPEVEKKGLKEYLLEGLMIFIAVMMGFIAENVREDYSEHQKAKAYAVTMVADLADDTTVLKDYIKYYNYALQNVDSLMRLLNTNDIKAIPTGKLYAYGLFGAAQRIFIPNDATFQQMKSTGALQYFERHIARKSAEYDQQCRSLELREANDQALYVEVRKFRAQIFEYQYNYQVNEIIQFAYKAKMDKVKLAAFIKSNPPILTYDKTIFNQYLEMVRSRFMDRQVRMADSVLLRANTLLVDIKKEYHVDE